MGCALAAAYNDATAESCHGDNRFLGVAWVYLPEVQAATEELERAVTELGLRAVKVVGGFGDVNLGSSLLDPFYGKASELNVPVLVHPTSRNHDNSDFNPILVGADKFGAEYRFPGRRRVGIHLHLHPNHHPPHLRRHDGPLPQPQGCLLRIGIGLAALPRQPA